MNEKYELREDIKYLKSRIKEENKENSEFNNLDWLKKELNRKQKQLMDLEIK